MTTLLALELPVADPAVRLRVAAIKEWRRLWIAADEAEKHNIRLAWRRLLVRLAPAGGGGRWSKARGPIWGNGGYLVRHWAEAGQH